MKHPERSAAAAAAQAPAWRRRAARRGTRLRLAVATATALVALSACAGKESPEALLDKARQSIAAKEPRAAEIHLKNLLQQADNGEARYLLGTVHEQAGDLVSAEKEYRRALEIGYAREKSLPALMRVLLAAGQAQKALDLSHDLALDDPAAKGEALALAGQALARLGKTDEARKTFDEALAAAPENVRAQVGAARILAGKDRAAARARIDALLARQPEAVEALMLRADFDILERKVDSARSTLAEIARLSPRDPEVHAKLVSLALDQKDLDGARKHHADLARLAPNAAATLYLKALIEARSGQTKAARDAVVESLERAPEYLPALALAGGLHFQLGELEQAERRARQLIDRAPNAVTGYRVLGATYLRMDAPDRALEAVNRPIERGAKDAMLFAIAGEAALKQNDAAGAARYFEQAAKLDPDDARKLTGLALSHLAAGDRERAIDELETAVELDSATPQAEMALVMALVRDRKFEQALKQVGQMDGRMPASPLPPTLRAAVLNAKGDAPGARSALEEAIKRDPKYFPAAANLAAYDLRDRKPEAARKRYQGVLAADPKNMQAHVAIAQLAASTGAPRSEVIDRLRQAREANPAAILPVIATARYMIETNTASEAVPLLQQAVNANPENAQLLDALGTALASSGQRTQAIATYERMLRVSPKSWGAAMRIGELHRAENQLQSALASFRKASDLAPEALEPRLAVATALHALGRKDEARKVAADLRANKKHGVAGLVLEGDLAASDREWPKAIAAFRKAFGQQQSFAVGAKLHRALRASGGESEAEAMMREWIKAQPENLQLRLLAGETEIARQRWQPAYEHYAAVLAKEPNNVLALNNAAWAMHELKDPRALDLARRAWEAAPKSAPIMDTYGVVLSARGDPKGIELLRQAVAASPEVPRFRLHLAQALLKAGDKASARSEIGAVLKASPEGPLAEEAKALQAKL